MALGICAALSVLASLVFLYLLPMTPGRLAMPAAELISAWSWWGAWRSLPLPFLYEPDLVAGLLVLAAWVAFLANAAGVLALWNHPPDRMAATVVGASVVTLYVLSALAPPNLNTDIYHYIARARVAAVHGQNPHAVPSSAFRADPNFRYVSPQYADRVDDKLAAWTLLSAGLAVVGRDGSPVANLMLFRVLFLAFNLGNVVLIAAILRRVSPDRALAGTVLYAWNPVAVVLGQSKTDTVMVFFFLLGAWLAVRRRRVLAVIAMTLSALVKLITLPLLGLYLVRQLRLRRFARLAVLVAIAAAVALAINAPFLAGADLLGGSIRATLREAGAPLPGGLRMLVIPVCALVFLAAAGMQDRRLSRLLWGWALIALCLSALVLRVSNAWYHLTLLSVVAILGNGPAAALALALTFSSFLFTTWYHVFGTQFQVPDVFALPRVVVYLIPAALVAAGIVAFRWWRRSRARPVAGKAGGG